VCEAAGSHGAVEVRTLSGKIIATLAIQSSKESVGAFRKRLLKSASDEDLRDGCRQSWLVYGCSVLSDNQRLAKCFESNKENIDSAVSVLTLVCSRPSSLAEHLAKTGLEADSLVDIVDSVFQVEHTTSMRHQPRAGDAARNLSPDLRAQVVDWIAIACNAVGLDDQLLHGAVLTLDRYCALQERPVEEAGLLRLCLAVLCTEMKLAPVDEFPCGMWQRVLVHLGQGREKLPDIFRAEADVLRQVGFNVWVPTALTFLRGLGLRLCHLLGDRHKQDDRPGPMSDSAASQLAFGRFFIDLALYDVYLQYSFPLSVLAAAALGAAQLATGSWSMEVHEILLEDLASYCPDLPNSRCLAEECEQRLLEMWRDCAVGTSRWTNCYRHLCERHSRPMRGTNEDASGCRLGDYLKESSPEAALRTFHKMKESYE
jgi:hypothetical protein